MEEEDVLYELGVDLNSNFTFENGDIKLSKYEDNLVQAIINRLNTNLDELELFYESYGSVIRGFLGWRADETTLSYISTEITTVLNDEPRITDFDINVEYKKEGRISIDLSLSTISNVDIETNLILGVNGVELSSDDENTDIEYNEE